MITLERFLIIVGIVVAGAGVVVAVINPETRCFFKLDDLDKCKPPSPPNPVPANLMQQGVCGVPGWGWHGPLTEVVVIGPDKWRATWPHVNNDNKADEPSHTFGITLQSSSQMHFEEYESKQSYHTTNIFKKNDTYYFDGQGDGGDARFCINGVVTLR